MQRLHRKGRITTGGVLLLAAAGAAAPPVAAETAVGETSVGGKIFLGAGHLDGQTRDSNGVDLTRFYIDVDRRHSRVWSAHLTTDINWLRDESPTDLWVKRAYLQGAFSKALTLRLGVGDMPWMSYVNQWAGYRYVDNELTGRLKVANSTDWGVHLLGTLGTRGQWQYATAVVTGSSYKRPRSGDSADVEMRVGWQPTAHTVLAVGGYRGNRALDGGEHVTWHTAQRWDAMAAYADERLRLGAQYFRADNWDQVRSPLADAALGWSAWASMQLAPQWTLFARHDETRTSLQRDPSRRDRYNSLGLEYSVSRKLQVALVAKRHRLVHDAGVLNEADEIGVWSQIAF
jgi:hypothetical protein